MYKDLAKKKQEEEAKRKREEELANKSKDRRKSKSPTLRLTLSSSKKNAAAVGEGGQDKKVVKGMAPRQIFTGYYGGGGNRTKIRQVVYDGALNVPKDASEIVRSTIESLNAKLFGESLAKSKYDLPQLGSVKRPSQDLQLLSSKPLNDNGVVGGVLITELRKSPSNATQVTNRRCVVKDSVVEKMAIDLSSLQRIRGGGDGDDEQQRLQVGDDVPQENSVQQNNEGDHKATTSNSDVTHSQSITTRTEDEPTAMDVDTKEENFKEPSATETFAKIEDAPSITNNNVIDTISSTSEVTETTETNAAHTQNESKEEMLKNIAVPTTNPPKSIDMADEESKATQVENKLEQETKTPKPEDKVNDDDVAKSPGENNATITPPKTSTTSTGDNTNEPNQNKEDKTSTKSESEDKTLKPDKIDSSSKSNTEPKSSPKDKTPKLISPLKVKNDADDKENDTKRDVMVGDQEPTTTLPSWYDPNEVSTLEITLLPEWFDQSANHRTKESYISTRESIIDMASKSMLKYVTGTAVRRAIPGDAGSLLRLHQLLVTWGFINGSSFNDSTPNEVSRNISKPASNDTTTLTNPSDMEWSGNMLQSLAVTIASFATKKRKRDEDDEQECLIDWDAVAQNVGNHVTPEDCYRKFLSTNFEDPKHSTTVSQMDIDMENTDDATTVTIDHDLKEDKSELIAQLIDGVRPSVIQAAIDSAFKATGGNIAETQKASLLAVVASQAAERAREEEVAVQRIQQEILDQRMAKLENRLSLLDDLECMFDAERMALELERRDLYTLRCRHWFSGDS